jgi:undecaprenyl-diphosphatase
MYTFDHDLFLALNFDGGEVMDSLMKVLTSPAGWTPLFLAMFYLMWRRGSWREVLLFVAVLGVTCLLADAVAGIGKHNGWIGSWWQPFEPRLRPMWEPALEGQVHVVREGGLYGTVSGHAANFVSIACVGAWFIRRRWMTALLVAMVVVVCYTRIYLAYHYPMDLLWGTLTGCTLSFVAIQTLKHTPLYTRLQAWRKAQA